MWDSDNAASIGKCDFTFWVFLHKRVGIGRGKLNHACLLVRRNPLISSNLAQVSKISLDSMAAHRQGNITTRLKLPYSGVVNWKCFKYNWNCWHDFTFGVGGALWDGPATTANNASRRHSGQRLFEAAWPHRCKCWRCCACATIPRLIFACANTANHRGQYPIIRVRGNVYVYIYIHGHAETYTTCQHLGFVS